MIREQFDMKGKVAIVTGASKGIGESIARGLAEFGAKVVVSSRKQDAVDGVAAGLRQDGLEAVGVACHVGDSAALGQLVEKTVATYGGVDILINNAATNPTFGPLTMTSSEVFDKIMQINVRAPFELAKLVCPIMEQRGGGSVVNISSIGGISPEPMLGIYSVSKAALISLTKVMAQEWGRAGIRANAICPGLIKTKFSEALWRNEEIAERFANELPLGRIAEPNEVAGLAVFLASSASSYATGGVYVVDGGHTI